MGWTLPEIIRMIELDFNPLNELERTVVGAMQVWEYASLQFSRCASGQVRTIAGDLRPSSVFSRIEHSEFLSNHAAWAIDVFKLLPRIGLK
jgi:hypothetical protein